MSAAAVQGRSHERTGTPCQDYAAKSRSQKVSLIVLSDGAGSALHSQKGARLVASGAMKFIQNHFHRLIEQSEDVIASEIIGKLHKQMQRYAFRAGIEFTELACTLLFVATNGQKVLCGQLGDGRMALFSDDLKHSSSVFEPYKGEFLNQTCFVTESHAVDRLQIRILEANELEGLAIMSDGAEESLYSRSTKTFGAGLSRMLSWLDQYSERKIQVALRENLSTLMRDKTQDDLSLAILRFLPDQR